MYNYVPDYDRSRNGGSDVIGEKTDRVVVELQKLADLDYLGSI
jgi:hypothetical protein